MANQLEGILFVAYFVIWLALGIVSTLHIRALKTAQEKKRWHDRYAIAVGTLVGSFSCFLLILWKVYFMVPVALLFCGIIGYLHLKYAFYCSECGKHSNVLSNSPHCPHCGNALR